jgi:fused signal recognition particle receptor
MTAGDTPSPWLSGLSKARTSLWGRISSLLGGGKGALSPADLADLEETLLLADVGASFTARCLQALGEGGAARTGEELRESLRSWVAGAFPPCPPLRAVAPPRVTFFIGVNGTGKTTTVGKLAARAVGEGRTVLLAAGDTFRAAAAEQLLAWSERAGCGFYRGAERADPAAVVHDAIGQAVARRIDEVFVDTAGRLHTKTPLMAELQKMAKVAGKALPGAPHEVMLVLDATIGQNALAQARTFTAALAAHAPAGAEGGVTGLVMTKMDGTSKGGILIQVASELKIPVRYVGLGEKVTDLAPFDAQEFAKGLVGG